MPEELPKRFGQSEQHCIRRRRRRSPIAAGTRRCGKCATNARLPPTIVKCGVERRHRPGTCAKFTGEPQRHAGHRRKCTVSERQGSSAAPTSSIPLHQVLPPAYGAGRTDDLTVYRCAGSAFPAMPLRPRGTGRRRRLSLPEAERPVAGLPGLAEAQQESPPANRIKDLDRSVRNSRRLMDWLWLSRSTAPPTI